ncbi:energy transducer TonB [Eisenibacter elegans]|uniref:energy transducer TonB n=1 Tax=Eisenibacter elegans TaxID=997 RepID=UPI00047D5986|nr:energy transducer TonB [Eisenibacter elegans]
MEAKKNPKVDVNLKTGMFFNIGLIISLAITLFAFEWRTYDEVDSGNQEVVEAREESTMEEPPITEMPPPPKPVIQDPEIIEVPDEEEIEEEIETKFSQVAEPLKKQEKVEIKFEAPKLQEEKTDEVFDIVEDQPAPDGGMEEFYKYIGKKMKYPTQARRMGIEGKVFVQFVVDVDGSLTDIKVVKGIGGGCDEEAVRVLEEYPKKWNPGKQRGRAVKVRMSLPIVFKLG